MRYQLIVASLVSALLMTTAACSETVNSGSANASNAGTETGPETTPTSHTENKSEDEEMPDPESLETITFGNGCFWCTEAVFQELKGVHSVVSGYMGGSKADPTYEEVCTGRTGHAEVVQIKYDPKVIPFDQLLEVFWQTHDPTTLNRQGADVGTQYRSAVFYHNDEQKTISERYKKKLDEAGAFDNPIVTEITKASEFYPAENYHQDYFKLNGRAPYCRAVIAPKMEKFRKAFEEKLK